MTQLLTSAQMRAIEQAAMESGTVTGLELMERAGRGVVEAILEEWPDLAKGDAATAIFEGAQRGEGEPEPAVIGQAEATKTPSAVILCGPGNNGGDGFVVARLLHEMGWSVEVYFYGNAQKLPADARTNYDRWKALGAVGELTDAAFKAAGDGSAYADLYIDAVFGSGLKRPLSGELDRVFRRLGGYFGDNYVGRIVSIDVPSGLCCDSGRVLVDAADELDSDGKAVFQPAFRRLARLTVTFDSPKVGHFLAQGPVACGRVAVKDIGVSPFRLSAGSMGASDQSAQRILPDTFLLSDKAPSNGPRPVALDISCLAKSSFHAHKYSHGHALVLSGGVGKGGAARLAARGALRIGAGAVTLGVPPAALIENAAQLNAVMLTTIKDGQDLGAFLKDRRITAICIGPGFGLSRREAELLDAALTSKLPICVDADALTLVARDKVLFSKLHENCVLTPHAGEFGRLWSDLAEQLSAPPKTGPAFSKVDAAAAAATSAGSVVLLKGADTLIAQPNGHQSVNASCYERSAPWLATAGSGDVLAGFVTGQLARGVPPMLAAELAAHLHTECALAFGPGLIAEDLPEALPGVMASMALNENAAP